MKTTTPHAVRWITGKHFNLRQYTKWHFTDNATFTGCGRSILLMDEFDHKLPDTDDDLSRVDCKLCRQRARQERTPSGTLRPFEAQDAQAQGGPPKGRKKARI